MNFGSKKGVPEKLLSGSYAKALTISVSLCHSREGGNPVFSTTSWIPVCTGMTYSVEIQSSR